MKRIYRTIQTRVQQLPSLHHLLRRYLILASLIPVVAMAVYYYYAVLASVEHDTKLHIKQVMSILQERVAHYNATQEKMLYLFTQSPEVQYLIQPSTSEEERRVRLPEIIEQYDLAYGKGYSMALGLENGEMYSAHSHELPVDYDPRGRPWYIDAVQSTSSYILSDPYPDAKDITLLAVTYSAQVRSQQSNSFLGVAGLDVNLNDLLKAVDLVDLPQDSIMGLYDTYGNLLTGSQPSEALSNQYAVFSEPVATNRWVIKLFWPNQALQDVKLRLLLPTSIGLGVFLVLALYYAYIIDRRLMNPIDSLIEQLQQVHLDDSISEQTILIKENMPRTTREIKTFEDAVKDMLKRIYDQSANLIENKHELSRQYMEIEALYEETTAMNETLNHLVDDLNDSWRQTIKALSNAIEANDYYTKGHCERVTSFALGLGKALNLSEDQLKMLEFASILHDVGKIAVPHHILNKPGALTEEERLRVADHPLAGFQIVKDVAFLAESAYIIRHHHERFDGYGYPDGLAGGQIPLASRIIAVVDAYDAMTSARAYRKEPLSHAQAMAELITHSGSQFDPQLVKHFITIMPELIKEASHEKDQP